MPAWLNPPNLLTALRLVLVPWVVTAILGGEPRRALVIFLLAAVTDGLDGILARRFRWSTSAGAYLDPIADKVLVSGVYLALAAGGQVPWWFVAVIFGRDILILCTSGAALVFTRIRRFPPSVYGKASTFLQVVTAVAWMAANAADSAALYTAAGLLIWPTTAATVWSGIHYGWRGLRLVRTH